MDLVRLKHLVAVVETGSIRHAAEVSGCSSAAMSKSIKALSRETGMQLLRPDGRGIRPTAQGRRLASGARRVLAELELVERSIGPGRHQAALRFTSFEPFTTYFLGEVAASDFQDCAISVAGAIPGEIERSVAHNLADVGLTYTPHATEGVQHRPLGPLPMAVFVGASSRLRELPLEDLPFVIPAHAATGATVRNRNADGWPQTVPRTIAHEVTALESALELCRRGLAAVFAPRFLADCHNRHAVAASHLVVHPSTTTLAVQEPQLHLVHRIADEDEALVHRLLTAAIRIVAVPHAEASTPGQCVEPGERG